MNISEILIQPQATSWLPWAVQYFFYIGSSYAAAILFLIALCFEDKTSHRVRSALVLVLAIGAIVGPLALTGDLHQPGRAWHFFTHITPWSWMSLGSLFLPLFSTLAVVTAWLYLRDDLAQCKQSPYRVVQSFAILTLGSWSLSKRSMVAIAAVTSLSGLTIALYTGAEIAIVASRPLWHQPAAPLLWFITAFLGAIGLTALILALLPTSTHPQSDITSMDLSLFKRSMIISTLLAFILLPLWASNNPHFTLYANQEWLIRLSTLSFSFIATLLLALILIPSKTTYLSNDRPRISKKKLILIALSTLFCCWYLRWVTMMDVQSIAKYDVGPFQYQLPLGQEGLLSILGMFGLWLALAVLSSELINSKKNNPPSLTSTHSQSDK